LGRQRKIVQARPSRGGTIKYLCVHRDFSVTEGGRELTQEIFGVSVRDIAITFCVDDLIPSHDLSSRHVSGSTIPCNPASLCSVHPHGAPECHVFLPCSAPGMYGQSPRSRQDAAFSRGTLFHVTIPSDLIACDIMRVGKILRLLKRHKTRRLGA